MKNLFKPTCLPWFTLGAGGVGLLLRLWLYAGKDEKGLLPEGHPASTLIFILTGLVLAGLFLLVRSLRPVNRYSRLFPAGLKRAVGCVCGGAGILAVSVFVLLDMNGLLSALTAMLGVMAAASLGYIGYLRLQGRRPGLLLQALLAAFFILYTVDQSRSWGSEPQLQEYFFAFLACIFLMIHAYDLAVVTSQKSSRRRLVFFNQAALYCSILSLNGPQWPFYLGMALWLTLDLCSLSRKRSLSAPPPEEAV